MITGINTSASNYVQYVSTNYWFSGGGGSSLFGCGSGNGSGSLNSTVSTLSNNYSSLDKEVSGLTIKLNDLSNTLTGSHNIIQSVNSNLDSIEIKNDSSYVFYYHTMSDKDSCCDISIILFEISSISADGKSKSYISFASIICSGSLRLSLSNISSRAFQ